MHTLHPHAALNSLSTTTPLPCPRQADIAPAGSALINGLSVSTQMARIRQDLGVCPQFDILWPEMTVLEHLLLHGAIKGFSGTDRHEAAEAAAQDVGECSRSHPPRPVLHKRAVILQGC